MIELEGKGTEKLDWHKYFKRTRCKYTLPSINDKIAKRLLQMFYISRI